MRRWLLPALVLFGLPCTALAQDAYSITLKKSGPGTVIQANFGDNDNENVTVNEKGKTVDTKVNKSSALWTYVEVTLERPNPAKKATLLKRTYQKAVVTEGDKSRALALEGKTVVIEKKGGKYTFQFEGGGAIPEADVKFLDSEFNGNADLELDWDTVVLPKKAVRVGDAWKIDMTEITRELERVGHMKLDAAKAVGVGKLLEVNNRNKYLLGEFDLKMELPIKAFTGKDGEVPMKAGAMLTIDMRITMCIDGTVRYNTGKMTMQINGTAVPPGNPNVEIGIAMTRMRQGGESEVLKK